MKKTYLKHLFLVAMFACCYSPLLADSGEAAFLLVCPDDVHVSCHADLYDLSCYGQARYKNHTGWHTAGKPVVKYNLGMCKTGTITRTWRVEDPNWNWETCTQTIYVGSGSTFSGRNITWPQDIMLTGCNLNTHPKKLPYTAGYPRWDKVECSMVGVSYKDRVFTVSPSCKKIIRVWKVMDCCQDDKWGTNVWTHEQKIKIINEEVPQLNCPSDVEVTTSNCKNAYVSVPPLQVGSSNCGGQYMVTNNSPYAQNNGNDISGTYPIGTTTVTYWVKYGCGNSIERSVRVTVKDKSQPTPHCVGPITVALMGIDTDGDGVNDAGMVDVLAKKFDHGSYAACGRGNVRFSFSPDTMVERRRFTCEHLGKNKVNVWVIDDYGNKNFCATELIVQNNGANIKDCKRKQDPITGDSIPKKYSIAGSIRTTTGAPVVGASVNITGKVDTSYTHHADTTITYSLDTIAVDTGLLVVPRIDTAITVTVDTVIRQEQWNLTSDAQGKYALDTSAVDSSTYRVTAKLSEAAKTLADSTLLQKVNSADLQLLMDVVLKQDSFTTAHQHVAADINRDGIINFDDLMIMYDYLTGVRDDLSADNWVLMANDSPNSGAEISVEIQSADQLNVGFTLVQIGKVTLNSNRKKKSQSGEQRNSKSQSKAWSVKAYPNPYHDNIHLAYEGSEVGTPIHVQFLDVSGRELYRATHIAEGQRGIISIHKEHDYKGLIIYKLVHKGQTTVGKLIKE